MQIKENCNVYSDDFYYDFFCGGYVNPERTLENQKDIDRVNEAKKVIEEYEKSLRAKLDWD